MIFKIVNVILLWLLVTENIFDFYDEKLPDNIISVRHFDFWWKKQKDKSILDFDDNFLYKEKYLPILIRNFQTCGYSFL